MRGKGGEEKDGIKERWKQKLAGAGQAFFLVRWCCIIYRRWWRLSGAKEASSPFLFCGPIPSGQALCWLDGCLWGNPGSYWAQSEGRAWLAHTETQQHYSNTMSVTTVAREEKKRTEREWQRMGEIVGVFDSGRKGRWGLFLWWEKERKKKKNRDRRSGLKNVGMAGEGKKGGRSPLQYFTALIYVYSWFCIIQEISWCNSVQTVGNGSLHQSTQWPHSSTPRSQQQVETAALSVGFNHTSVLLKNVTQRAHSQNA